MGGLTGLADKRVAIIGTGATAVQIVPHLGNHAKQVYVFQRTPSSIDVRGNRPTDPEWAKSLKPGWQLERMENFDRIVNGGIEERDLVNDGWTDILHNLLARGKPSDDPVKAAAERQIADFEKMEQVRKRASDIVKDPATAEALKPWVSIVPLPFRKLKNLRGCERSARPSSHLHITPHLQPLHNHERHFENAADLPKF